MSTLNLSGTFYYPCSILDGASRSIDHYEIREPMTEQAVGELGRADVEIIPATARRAGCGRWKPFPRLSHASSRTMVRNLWRRISRLSFESRAWIMCGLRRIIRRATERWHKSLKSECIRPKTPLNLDEARRLISAYVGHYNPHRLHSAIGTIAPADKQAGRAPEILEHRERKRSKARAQRAENRRLQAERPVGVVF